MGHVGPAGKEHVVVTGGPELPGGGDLEVLDVELDPHLAQHGGHGLGDLELLRVEVLHEDEVEGEVLVAGLPEDRLRLLRVVGLLAEVRVTHQSRRHRAVHGARVAEQEILDDHVAVDGEGDGLPDAGVLHRVAVELEDPALGLDGGDVEHAHARARLQGRDEVRSHAVDDVELAGPDAGSPGRQLGDEAEGHAGRLGEPLLPVALVGGEADAVAVGPLHEPEGSGAHRLLEELVLPARRARGQHPQHGEVGGEGAEGTLGRHRDRVVAILLDRLHVLVDERLDQLRVVADALDRVDDAVRREGRPVVEEDAAAEDEAPRRVAHRAPRLGEGGDELRVVGDVDQWVEDVTEDRRRRDRVMVAGVEGQGSLGEAGDDLAPRPCRRLGPRGPRLDARPQHGAGSEQERASADSTASLDVLTHRLAPLDGARAFGRSAVRSGLSQL